MAKKKSPERLVNAAKGKGCNYCEHGIPIDYSERSKVMIKLCLACVMVFFRGWTVDAWEDQHAPLADHLGDRLDRAIEKERADSLRELLTVN